MKLTWAVQLAGWTIARQARAAARQARCYRGEFTFGTHSGEPVVFGVFGDSVGCGFGATALDQTFAGFVAQRLAERRRVLCRISAVNGTRARTLDTQGVAGDERFAAISIGTNDALHGDPLPEVERALKGFLEKLSHAELVVVVGPGALADVTILPEAFRPFVRRHMQAYEQTLERAVSACKNAVHIGPSSLRVPVTRSHFAADGFHPGDMGQRLIGELVYDRFACRALDRR